MLLWEYDCLQNKALFIPPVLPLSTPSTLSLALFSLVFTPCKAEQPLRRIALQEKKKKKMKSIQASCVERTYR